MTSKPAFIIVACLVLTALGPAYAQQRGGQGAPAQKGQGLQQQDRLRDPSQNLDRDGTKDQVYGYQLMTEDERIAYRNKMRSLGTQQERDAFRLEHHQLMRQRAAERGVELPEVPLGRAAGMGPGARSGAGIGPGAGMRRGQQQVQQQTQQQSQQQIEQRTQQEQPTQKQD
jgi:hypothetical protein